MQTLKPIPIILNILVILCGFSAPWGSGFQEMTRFDLSKIFVLIALMLIAYWLFFAHYKIRTLPKYLNYFVLFMLINGVVTYGIFFPEYFKFGYTAQVLRQDGFIKMEEATGIYLARIFIFVLLVYALSNILNNKKRLMLLSFGYGLGMVIAVLLVWRRFSSVYLISGGRFSGGFLDPNSLGMSAAVVIFLNIFTVSIRGINIWNKLFAYIVISFGLVALMSSGSRAAILAFCVGIFCMLIIAPTVKRRVKIIISLFIITIVVIFLFIPEGILEMIGFRFVNIKLDRGSERLDIWLEYLKRLPSYALLGVGIARSSEVIRYSWYTGTVTHNTYLQILVELGVFGLALFTMSLRSIYKQLMLIRNVGSPAIAVILGLFITWLTISFFMNTFSSRDTWIVFGVVLAYIRTARNNAM